MAVVQISRIQQRRGREQETDIPQLASAEFAWAVDTQKLYIGNGSVAEGAPYVGNTEILTEHSDLFSVIGRYQFAKASENYTPLFGTLSTGSDANYPVIRSLQETLDQWVTVGGFGVKSDTPTVDQTAGIQRAIDQLFLNTDRSEKTRVVLEFPPGIYKLTNSLYIPSNANIVGAGKGKTVFSYTGSNPMVVFINDDSTSNTRKTSVGITGNKQPKNINIEGITFTTTAKNQTGWQVNAVRDSSFKDIKIAGGWNWEEDAPQANSAGLLFNVYGVVTCEHNFFSNIDITGFTYGIFADGDINTNKIDAGYFSYLYKGIVFGENADLFNPGQLYGPKNFIIQRSIFFWILKQGFRVKHGGGNISYQNRYINVGNESQGSSNAIYPHIDFFEAGNASISDNFDREDEMEIGSTYSGVAYAPTVNGRASRESFAVKKVNIGQISVSTPLFRLPLPTIDQPDTVEGHDAISYEISYLYRSTTKNQTRSGKLLLNIDVTNDDIQLVDDYQWTGTPSESASLEFTAEIIDANLDSINDSLQIKYTNTSLNDVAVMYYSYRVIS